MELIFDVYLMSVSCSQIKVLAPWPHLVVSQQCKENQFVKLGAGLVFLPYRLGACV